MRRGQLPNSSANGLAVDAGGALHVIGTFDGTVDFDFGAGVTTLTSAQYGSAFVAKYTADRNYEMLMGIYKRAIESRQEDLPWRVN